MTRRPFCLFAVVAVATLAAGLLTACGDDGAGTPSATNSASASAVTGSTTAQATAIGTAGSSTAVATRTTASATTASSTKAPPATPSGPGRCASSDLALAQAPAGAAAGTHFIALSFTNEGKANCTISGYPGVSLQDANGRQLGDPAGRAPAGTAGTPVVTLAPGDSAHALIAIAAHENFDAGVCAGPSTTVVVYPPDETQALTVPLVDYVCPGFSVQVVKPGKTEQN